jgi:hypothetical protein
MAVFLGAYTTIWRAFVKKPNSDWSAAPEAKHGCEAAGEVGHGCPSKPDRGSTGSELITTLLCAELLSVVACEE